MPSQEFAQQLGMVEGQKRAVAASIILILGHSDPGSQQVHLGGARQLLPLVRFTEFIMDGEM